MQESKKHNQEGTMKLYKVINKDNKSMNGGTFDWTEYLPEKSGKPGKWTKKIKTDICHSGYHVTPYWNMWMDNSSDRFFEVECKGVGGTSGVVDKFVCESVRLVKEIFPEFDKHYNTGDRNTGYGNTGHLNTGDNNTGNTNTGNTNTGDNNTGYRNTGKWNTGNWNTGHTNTGNWNTGNWNTGRFNTGNWNTGCFNTKEPDYYELFNKVISKKEYNNINFPSWLFNGGDLKKALKGASKQEIDETVKLPNFSYDIFKEVTGLSKAMLLRHMK